MKNVIFLILAIGFATAHADEVKIQIKPLALDKSKVVGTLTCAVGASTIKLDEAGRSEYTPVEEMEKDFFLYNHVNQHMQNLAWIVGSTELIETKVGTFRATLSHDGTGKPNLIVIRSQTGIALLNGAKLNAEGGPEIAHAGVSSDAFHIYVTCRTKN